MSQNALTETSRILLQFCFFVPLVFLITYTIACPWWRTYFGRVIAVLAFAFTAVLLRSELFLWGVFPSRELRNEDFLAWFSVGCLALAPLAFLTLTWQLIRKPVSRQVKRLLNRNEPDPLIRGAHSQPLGNGTHGSGQDVGPAGDVDSVNSGPEH